MSALFLAFSIRETYYVATTSFEGRSPGVHQESADEPSQQEAIQ